MFGAGYLLKYFTMNNSTTEANNLKAFLQALPMHIMHDEVFGDIDFDTKLQVARALGSFIDKELPRVVAGK